MLYGLVEFLISTTSLCLCVEDDFNHNQHHRHHGTSITLLPSHRHFHLLGHDWLIIIDKAKITLFSRYGTLNGRIRKKWVFCSNDPLLIRWLIISCEEGMSWAWLIHEEIRKNVIWKNLAKKGILLHWSLDDLLHWTFPKKRRLMILLWLIFFYKGNILTNI